MSNEVTKGRSLIILKNYIIELIKGDIKYFSRLPSVIEVIDTDTGEIIKFTNPNYLCFLMNGNSRWENAFHQVWCYMGTRRTIPLKPKKLYWVKGSGNILVALQDLP